jgi:cell division protein FtsQ
VSAKIARGSSQRGRSTGSSGRGKVTTRRAAPNDTLPLPEFVRRVSWWLFGGMTIALAIAVLTAFKVPQMAGLAIGEAIGRSGFVVRRIEPKGINHLNPMLVYRVADSQMKVAMPLVDLAGTRLELLRYGWVRDARVSRRLPDTLVIDIVERVPAAIWQHGGRLALIDNEGVVLEAVKLEAMPDLPLVIGPAANRQVPGLTRLTKGVPQLEPLLAGATWVGGRRWDLRFHSGEVLSLPEGHDAAAVALAHFVEKDRKGQLLGRGFVRFDMRIPGKLIVRLSLDPSSAVPSLAPPVALPDAAPRKPVLPAAPVDPKKTI